MSALGLCVFLSPASVPGAGPEHTCPCRPAGAQVFTGTPTGAGGGLGGGRCLAHLDPHGQRRLCQGRASDLGPAQSEEALAGATQVRNSCGWKRPCVGGSGPGLVQLEEALVGRRNSGPGTVPPGEALVGAGVQAWDPSRLMGARGAGGDAGRITLQSPDSVKVPLLPC